MKIESMIKNAHDIQELADMLNQKNVSSEIFDDAIREFIRRENIKYWDKKND